MSEKVVLTQEQAQKIEEMRSHHRFKDDKNALIKKHVTGWMNDYKILNELDLATFSKLVVSDYLYEVGPMQFKTGDKVVHIELEYGENPVILTLIKPKLNKNEEAWWHGRGEWDYANDLRLATPDEIYWLEELGREKVPDFRQGDIFVNSYGRVSSIDKEGISVESAQKAYRSKAFQGIYPAESFKPLRKEVIK